MGGYMEVWMLQGVQAPGGLCGVGRRALDLPFLHPFILCLPVQQQPALIRWEEGISEEQVDPAGPESLLTVWLCPSLFTWLWNEPIFKVTDI